MRRTTLVTGATGFIGACLTRRLVKNGYDVHIFTRMESNKWRIQDIIKSVTEHQVDLRDKEAVESAMQDIHPSIIYHLAAYGAYHFQTDIDRIMKTNILGTLNLVRACAELGFDCFVNMGSSSEYGPKKKPMREDDILEPVDFYDVSKAAASLLCQSMGKSRTLPIFTLRPFAVYGYYEEPTRLVPTVIKACLEGRNPVLLSPHSVRDFIFVEDVIDVLLRLAETVAHRPETRCDIFNVGYGKQYTVRALTSKIIELTGANVRPLWGHALKRKKIEPKSWVSDSSKIRRFLKWKPRFDLDSGLQRTVDWFEENLHLYRRANEDE